MDFDEDDGPPELIETGVRVIEEEKPVKVPITIVTGTVSPSRYVETALLKLLARIPGSRENNTS